MIYYKQEKFSLAEVHFRRALAINPQSSALICHVGVVSIFYEEMGIFHIGVMEIFHIQVDIFHIELVGVTPLDTLHLLWLLFIN